ncbi:hypothetical protein FBEOM_4025 [Fusarium beomiforme]|uniref:Uncharacterized protein n=1 Tax=Fusarium beomiforme TaxID=44412 RepID=A0A9P5ANU9_9HYPO|nr:hypothetical protein FBEOM_4025 [Fusarium beomiforme]
MSFYQQEFHHTAKLSKDTRRMVLRQAEKKLWALMDTRDEAASFALVEVVAPYAALHELPPKTDQELRELEDWSDEADTDINESADGDDVQNVTEPVDDLTLEDALDILRNGLASGPRHPIFNTSRASRNVTTTGDHSAVNHWLSNTPDEYPVSNEKSSDPEVIDTVQPHGVHSGTEGNDNEWLSNAPGAPYDGEEDVPSPGKSDDSSPSPGDEGYVTGTQENNEDDDSPYDGDAEDNASPADQSELASNNENEETPSRANTLFLPSLGSWPDRYKRTLARGVESYRAFLNSPASDHMRHRLLRRETHEAAVKEYNLIGLGLYPLVTTADLIEFKRHCDDLRHFCLKLRRNVTVVDYDLQVRNELYYTQPKHSPLRLRTKGLRSALRYVIGIDEEWGNEEDNWGQLPPMKKRDPISAGKTTMDTATEKGAQL